MEKRDERILRYEKKCKIINGIFVAAVLIIFLAFIILLKKLERGPIHFALAALLVGIAVLYKIADKKMKIGAISLSEKISGRDADGLSSVLRTLLYDFDKGELQKYFSAAGKNVNITCNNDEIQVTGLFGDRKMIFFVGNEGVVMKAYDGDEVYASRKAGYAENKTPESIYKLFSEFISRNY